MQETLEIRLYPWVWGGPLEEGVATHSSVLAWEILWREKPGRLQPMGSQRVSHDWSDLAHTHTHTILNRSGWKSLFSLFQKENTASQDSSLFWDFPEKARDPTSACFACVSSVTKSHPALRPHGCGPPGSSLYGISQTRILEQVAISSSKGRNDPNPGIKLASPVSPELADSLPLSQLEFAVSIM